MTDKLENLINRLSPSEHITLAEQIERQYAVEYIEPTNRDAVRDIVFKLIQNNFTSPKFIVQEHYMFAEIEMAPDEVNALSEMIMDKFDIESIEFSRVMEWQRVGDIINYIVNEGV